MKDIKYDSKNYRTHSEKNKRIIKKSVDELGAGRSILLDSQNIIIAGNGVKEAWGDRPVKIIETDGSELIAVKRTDLNTDDKKRQTLSLIDNHASDTSDFDNELVNSDFDKDDLDEWEFDSSFSEQLEAKEDNYVIPDEIKTDIVLGDLFEIGQHRLLCGDSTNADDVQKLIAGGNPNLMVTDLPYGVNYKPTWRHEAGIINSSRVGKVSNDDRVDWSEAWSLFTGSIVYVWHAGQHASEVQLSLEKSGFKIRCQIIWVKQQMVFSRGDYHWQHEPCWYAVKNNGNWCGDRRQTTVWQITSILQSSKQNKEDAAQVHGTQKPVECMSRPIRNNTFEKESVYDPFLGSGTTLVAAHQLNRMCYGMEIDPKYCQVIIDRMRKLDPSIQVKCNGLVYNEITM